MPLYRVSGGGSGLPPGGAPGQTVSQDESGEVVWIDMPTMAFRGDWEEDSIVFAEGFSGGIAAPFSTTTAGPGVTTFAVGNNATNPPPGPYTQEIQMWMNTDMTNRANLHLDVASLGLSGLTRAKFWLRTINSTWDNGRASVMADGVEVFTRDDSDRAWAQMSVPIPAGVDQLTFRHLPRKTTGGSSHGSAFAGIELYASAEPYMLGQFVTHQGKMWKSLVNNNATTPGVGNQWQEAITLPAESGTTAQRPAPATAGAAFQYYDTTLNKPIWVNAAASGWVDATGAAV